MHSQIMLPGGFTAGSHLALTNGNMTHNVACAVVTALLAVLRVQCHSLTHLHGELVLLASEAGPYISLHLARGCTLEHSHQQGIARCPTQVLTELCKEGGNIVVDAHYVLLPFRRFSEV